MILLDIAAMIIIFVPLIAQLKVKNNYKKYSNIKNSLNITGKDVAKKILEMNGLEHLQVLPVSGELTDHYDPTKKIINLSENIYNGNSIAAVAVAAHEVGHAIQHKVGYEFFKLRSNLVPAVNFTSRISTIFLILGFAVGFTPLVSIGILCLSVGLLFQLVTLPVEFNASSRAKEQLKKCGLIEKNDTNGTKKMLKAAALTYVASFLATAVQILRLLLINNRRR